jgi:uncharacterized protein YuzE
MNHPRMTYFEKDDVLHLSISNDKEAGSVEIAPNVTVELNDKGELIGVEILEASRFVRDTVLESAQGRMLQLPISRPHTE